MFPGRFALGVGAGEAMNEAVFMGRWPKWGERIGRLTEAIDLIRRLWASEDYFTYAGRFFKMENVRLSPRPKSNIPIFFSAIGVKAAYVAGKCSNKLLTLGSVERCRDFIFPKFNEGVISVGRTPSRTEKVVVVDGGIGDRYKIVKRIKTLIAGASVPGMFNERDPRKIEKAGSRIADQQIIDESNIFEKGDELIEILSRYTEIGADQIIWQDFSDDPNKMLHAFQTKIIPYFKEEEK